MTERRAIVELRAIKRDRAYSDEAIDMAIAALKALPVAQKINRDLFERLRELERAE